MNITTPFSMQCSETWLLERTYHAQLRNGRELSVPNFTEAMKAITDCYVPISSWQEISQEEAHTSYEQGVPVLLYGENAWKHPKDAAGAWGPNTNMQRIIFGTTRELPETVSGIDYAVRYLDVRRGHFSNPSWRKWFASDASTIFDGSDLSTVTFLGPCVQFPYTTHYTVIAPDGQIYAYADRAEAIEAFGTFSPQMVNMGNEAQAVFPQFCYYHEVVCPGGSYRLEFVGPHMNEPAYQVKEIAPIL